jgi:arabinan endo-1,5-alpha-L-arabinosidase
VGTDKSGNKCYYIFGSHLAWAKSYDLKNWSTFTNNINTSFNSLFASAFNWSKAGDPQYDNGGNMWAPDVIWNAAMNKWCMYMSINGRSWNSSIVMLTADSLEGNWTYVGPVVYSGFNKSGVYSYTNTDYALATGDTDFSKYGNRFISGAYVWIKDSNNNPVTTASTWNGNYGAHAIDPSVFYDKNGQLWMTYGSWSGGIWMLKLNNSNGLRDYATTYAYNNNVTDPYMGYHLSGGNFVSGEASYIVYDEKTANYYLYVTYHGLFRTGGYQMRLFKSNNVTGPYVDADGTNAASANNASVQTGAGIKLFGNYHFTSFTGSLQLNANGYMAPGHNSAFIDSDGSYYLIYHTRFNNNTENHQVRVHQQFLNEDNWLVTAVYENRGDKISPTGYSMDDMAGTYEAVDMGTGNEGGGILSKRTITLNKDGSVSGYLTGTWKYSNSQMTITAGSVQYKGVFFKQKDESNAHNLVMTFSCIGTNSIAILGTK